MRFARILLKCERQIRFFSSPDSSQTRRVPKLYSDYKNLMKLSPVQPASPRLLKVSIIGEPNAGKSTLTNRLVKWRVCSVSKKVHTTKHNTSVVMVDGDTQIVFLDTPGLVSPEHGKKHNLEHSLVVDPESSILHADVIAVIVDASNINASNQLSKELLNLLQQNSNRNSFLILNKVDKVKTKHNLLKISRTLIGEEEKIVFRKKDKMNLNVLFQKTERKLSKEKPTADELTEMKGWKSFSKVFMVSALTGDGVDDVRNYLFSLAYPSPWIYHSSVVTNQSPEEIAIMTVREKLLDRLPKEIPYNLDLKLEMLEETNEGLLRIAVLIICPRKTQVKLIIGEKGNIVSKISDEARQDLANTFRCNVSLKLIIKHKDAE
ncbi:GTPase Era, mitochondrial isoform X1 [Centruroides vittatus]|uniref:GTPase Era, mitochondrial isoform X1 n=2 Tax=Centruroides vittatus TaxID=120091 RepID=UPI00350EA1FC